ncbi:MAG: mechanosensitive ion channel family protein [Chloroflexi bacterium]|nr:mechanosensitive ion channel family protein [Chloroflexota bacterium]
MLAEFLEETFGQQTGDLITRLLLGVAILAATWLVREIVTAIIPALIRKVTRRTRITWDDQIVRVIRPPLRFLIVVYGLWFAIRVLEPPAELEATAEQIMRTLVVIGIFWAIYRAVDPAFRILFRVSRRTMRDSAVPDLLDRKLSSAITQVAKGLVIVFAFATVLETWHYNVAGLIAGLGIAGAAVALAVKDTLANLFAYFVILADEPFTLGDYVVFGDVAGTVENIGFRSSRIRALDQSLVTVPNNTVMNANVTNWSRLTKRRLNMTLSIGYGNSPDQVLSVVQGIRKMLENHELVQSDSVVVQFVEFNSNSLDIMVICFITVPDWGDFQAARQDINLKIMDILAERGVDAAFPNRTLLVTEPEKSEPVQPVFPPPEPEPTLGTATDSPIPHDAAN